MSLKRQLKQKYQNFKFSLQTISLPSWMVHPRVRLILFFIIFIFSAAYIANMTASATSGYQVRVLEKQTEALQIDVQKLQVEVADNSSMNNIAGRIAKLNMVVVDNMHYLSVKDASVAKN